MNQFYRQSLVFQWVVSVMMLIVLQICFYYWFELMYEYLIAIILIFIMTPISQFLLTPFMKLTGFYKYISPMLIIYLPTKTKYDLHNSTSFDYLFHYKANSAGIKWQYRLLEYYIEGLLAIIEEIEKGEIPEDIEIRGSSYFFSKKTAQRLGFEIQTAGSFEKINIVLNYIDLLWMYSLSKGHICFPTIKDIRTATTTGSRLLKKKPKLLELQTFLQEKNI